MGKKLDIFVIFVDYYFQLDAVVLQLNLNNGTSTVLAAWESISWPHLPCL
jgi:hypothetical protein